MFDPKRRIQKEKRYDRVDMVPDALHSITGVLPGICG